MVGRRTLNGMLGGMVALVAVAMPASPAVAHGAPDNPVSRTMACAPDGPHVRSEACQAALAASDRQAFEDWDYVRVAGVDGRDREVIPDGALCSGGVAGFAGLDLPRTDWPVTEVRAGAEFTFIYRTTIPHQGEFRWYVTKDSYDPEQPLGWSDLEEEPFLTAADPELVGDTYRMPGRLPDGKTGRHIVFTIWQNSDTPDTYYACSDVVFEAPATVSPSPTATTAPTTAPPASPAAEPVGLDTPSRSAGGNVAVPLAIAAALAAAVVVVGVIVLRPRSHGRRRLR
jgi:predicted carbohydrate-binding protein with CBM5 and CBM33 domain